MRIILGVSGGIAAYKAVLLLRLLKEAGHSVRVIPTKNALKFVGKATWEALSGEPVTAQTFADVPGVAHVALGQGADLVIVAPATADLLSRAATGRADDLLTNTLLVATCPIVYVPAMHTQMWQHPATQANVATLRQRGALVIEPDSGRLTGADSGPGRLPEPGRIMAEALTFAEPEVPKTSSSRSVVVTAGGTREPIDPVRWIGNRSSGKQGLAIAQAAAQRGLAVTLIAANIDQGLLDGAKAAAAGERIRIVPVETCLEMLQAVREAEPTADAVVMTAAVADYRPLLAEQAKVKKQAGEPKWSLELVENPDILAELCQRKRPGQVIVGFAAETGDAKHSVLDYGRAKAQRKGADLLAVNDVSAGQGFGTETNKVWLLNSDGDLVAEAAGTKRDVAEAIVDAIATRWN